MFEFVQHWVLQSGALGALGFFVGAFLEEIAFPFPSPLLLIGVAFFVGKPLNVIVVAKMLVTIILPIVCGASLGSLVIFGVAYAGGKRAVDRFGGRLKIFWSDVERLRHTLAKHKSDDWALFLSRCLPFTPTTLLTVFVGVVRMRPVTFVMLTFLGIFIRVSALFVGALIFSGVIFH